MKDKDGIIKRLADPGVVPVLRLPEEDAPLVQDAIAAYRDAGVTAVELTMSMKGAPELLRRAKERLGDTLLVGMGTISSSADAEAAVDAGADFLVSPYPIPEALPVAVWAGVPFAMGALTPGEIRDVLAAGADIVKIFPFSSMGGVEYLKMLKGPFGAMRTFPSGEVTRENVRETFAAGATAVAIGPELVRPDLFRAGKWGELAAIVREYIAFARSSIR